MLQFTFGNAKLGKKTAILDLPAGHTCPFANDCRSTIDRETGKMIEGGSKFRCYAASAEMYSPACRHMRWRNMDALKGCKTASDYAKTIETSLHNAKGYNKIEKVRMHSSGDFFSQAYFDGWLEVAKRNPHILFYCYTKSLKFWMARMGNIPANFKLTASKGGKLDSMIQEHNLRFCEVVLSHEEAEAKGLPLDHDDSYAWKHNVSFAILIHGTQNAGSEASVALTKLRKNGVTGYRRGSKAGGRKQ